jgi:hypothetical protein
MAHVLIFRYPRGPSSQVYFISVRMNHAHDLAALSRSAHLDHDDGGLQVTLLIQYFGLENKVRFVSGDDHGIDYNSCSTFCHPWKGF